jgi:hypothetical protein
LVDPEQVERAITSQHTISVMHANKKWHDPAVDEIG